MDKPDNQSQQDLQQELDRYLELKSALFLTVRRQIHLCNLDQALLVLEQTGNEIAGMDLDAGLREALDYDLVFFRKHINWHPENGDWNRETYLAAIEDFSRPARTTLGDQVRRVTRMVIKMHADNDGLDYLDRQEIDGFLDSIPAALVTSIRFTITTWAFDHSDLELIEQSYEHYLTNPPVSMGQAQWQRVNLMYLLLKGKATSRDVQESIKTLELIPQINDFRERLWPAAKRAGLITQELEQQLEERIAKVMEREEYPHAERRTKSFIKGAN